jgi:hypothetical protein
LAYLEILYRISSRQTKENCREGSNSIEVLSVLSPKYKEDWLGKTGRGTTPVRIAKIRKTECLEKIKYVRPLKRYT